MWNESGLYKILNKITNDYYVGSTKSFIERKYYHWLKLKQDKHYNPHLQRAWNKYGENSFEFIPLLYCDPSKCLFYEQQYFNAFKPYYNISIWALAPFKGRHHTEESKRKISLANKGKDKGIPLTEDRKRKISIANTGKKRTQNTLEKMSLSHKFEMKPVERIDIKTGEIKEYESISATKKDGFNYSHVAACCRNERNMHKGYYWKFR